MPQSGAIRAGRAYVELFADDSKLVRGLRLASVKLKAFGEGIRSIGLKMFALGAAVVTPLFAAAKSFANVGSQLWDMSKRTGVSVEALSALGYAATETGTDIEGLEKGLRKMQRTVAEAGAGSKPAQESLALLGLTVKDLAGLSPEDQFKRIAQGLARIGDPTIKAAAAMKIFGRAGTELLPMLEGGKAGLDAYTDKARRLGLIMSTADAKAAKEFGIALKDLWAVLHRTVVTVGMALAPMFKSMADWITTAMVKTNQWIRQHQEIVVGVFKVAAIVLLAGAALTVLGTAILGVAKALKFLTVTLPLVNGLLNLTVGALAFLLTPIGMVVAGLVAMGAYFLYASGVAADALDWLGERFSVLRDDAAAACRGIGDALAAGDIPLAGKVLWASLKLVWLEGIADLEEAWTIFSFAFKLGMENLKFDATKIWLDLIYGMRSAWAGFQQWHAQAVNSTAKGIFAAWEWLRLKLGQIGKEQYDLEMRIGVGTADDRAKAIDAESNAKMSAIDAEHKEALRLGEQDHQKAVSDLTNESDARIQKQQAVVDQAKAEWKELLKQAQDERAAAGRGEGPGKPVPPPPPEFDWGQLTRTFTAVGTFNAANVLALQGAGTAQERTAKATEQTAQNTARLERLVQRGGQLVYG